MGFSVHSTSRSSLSARIVQWLEQQNLPGSMSLFALLSIAQCKFCFFKVYCRCNRSVDIAPIPFLKLINSFDRKLINFLLLLDEPIRFRFRTDLPIGNAQEVKRNLNLYELINLRK
jgi:hypothetical protein